MSLRKFNKVESDLKHPPPPPRVKKKKKKKMKLSFY